MEKSKEKRQATAKMLSDELDKIPTKQVAEHSTALKAKQRS